MIDIDEIHQIGADRRDKNDKFTFNETPYVG